MKPPTSIPPTSATWFAGPQRLPVRVVVIAEREVYGRRELRVRIEGRERESWVRARDVGFDSETKTQTIKEP